MDVLVMRIVNALDRVGVMCDPNFPMDEIEIMDSLQYISAILELESEFGVECPDEYLDGSAFKSLYFLKEIIQEQLKMNKSKSK